MKFLTRLRGTASAAAVAAAMLSGAAMAQGTITLGFTGPLSGGAALYGKNVMAGLQMAADELNEAGIEVGGKQYKLQFQALDDKYSPAEAALNARRLVQQYRTPAVFVPHSGGIFALQAFNQQENFLLMAYSSVPSITTAGNPLTIRIPPAYTGYIEPFIKMQMERYGKKIALIPADHDYAKAWVKDFVPAWEAAGGEIVANNPMSYNKATDFYSGVSRALAAKPDVIFVGGASEPTALVVKQARELGFKGGVILMDQAKLDEMARVTNGYEMLEGAIGTMPLVSDARPGAAEFVENFRKAHGGRDPTSEMSLNYTMVYALIEAMKRAGTVDDPAAIRARLGEALAALPPAHNPHEIRTIDEQGGTVSDTPVAFVNSGKIEQYSLSQIGK